MVNETEQTMALELTEVKITAAQEPEKKLKETISTTFNSAGNPITVAAVRGTYSISRIDTRIDTRYH